VKRLSIRGGNEKAVGQFLVSRLSTRKAGVLLHFNHIATVSTGWRAQNLFESLTFTSRYMYRLAAERHLIT
jgi:hypothetical protein